jgi:hypothetical protein
MFPSDALWSDASCFNRRDVFGLAIGLAAGGLASRPCAAATPKAAIPCVELRSWYAAQKSGGDQAARQFVQESLANVARERGTSIRSAANGAEVAAALGKSSESGKLETAIQNSIRGDFTPQNEALINTLKTWRRGSTISYKYVGRVDERCRVRMKAAFATWSEYCCLDFQPVRNPRNRADLRISFIPSRGHYSNIGIDSKMKEASSNNSGYYESMNIDPTEKDDEYLSGVCLHELGHAIGLQHEHQNPIGGGVVWNRPIVIARLRRDMGWSDQKIIDNVLGVLEGNQYRGTEVDKDSIMMYWFGPNEVISKGKVPETPNTRLSKTDIDFVRSMYGCTDSKPQPRQENPDPVDNKFAEKIDEIRQIQKRIQRP